MKICLKIAAFACLGLLLVLRASGATVTWNGSANSDWFNTNNWTPASVPAATDTVVFNSGTINLTAPVTIAGVLNWSGGTLGGNFSLTVASSGALNLISSNTKVIENVLTNAGTVTWQDGDFGVYNYNGGFTGAVENVAGGLWDIQCDRNMYDGYGGGTPRFDNAGTVRKSAGTGISTFSIPFNNAGTMTVQTGTVNFNSGGVIESTFNASAGAATHFNSGAFSYSTVPTLNGPGAIQFTGGTLTLLNNVIPNLQLLAGTITLSPSFQGGTITNLNFGGTLSGDYTVSGTLTLGNGDSGTLTVLNGATFNWSGGNLGGLVLNNGATLNWSNGTLLGPLDVVVGAVVNWSGGTAANIANVRASGALNLIGSNLKAIENVLTNAGTVTWLDGDFGVYNYNGGFSGAVENLAGGLWDIQCDRNMYDGYGGGTPRFDNAGTVQKSAGTGTTTFSIPFNNAGTMTAQTGTVNFNSGGVIESTFNASAGAAIHFNSGAFSYSTVPALNGPGAIQFTGGTLTLLNNPIPNLQMLGGTITLGPSFQGGTITNLNFGGSLSGDYTVSGTLTLGNGDSGTLTVLNGATLNWNGGNLGGLVLNNGATLNWSNGTLLGPLDVVGGAVVNWSGGTAVNIANVRASGALNLIGSNLKVIENVLTNAGTVTWLDGDFGVYNYNGGFSGAVENLAGGLWDIQCDRNMYDGYGGGTPRFDNAGTVQKSAGTGTTTFSIAFNNAGTMTAQTGTVNFNGGGIIESTFNAAAGTAIHFNSGAFSYSTVPALNGPGAIQFTGGTLTLLNNVIPNLQILGGTITLGPSFQGGTITNLNFGGTLSGDYTVSGTLTLGNGDSGTLTVLNGATLNWNGGNLGGLVLNAGATLNWSNGTLLGPLDVVGGAVVNWSGGTAVNIANVRASGALNLIGSNLKVIENVLTNAGTVTWLDGDFGVYNYNGGFTGAVENLAGGLWDIQCDRNMYDGYGGGTPRFDNAGTVQKSAGTGTTTFSIAFNNAGTMTVQTGAVNFNGGGIIESTFNAAAGTAIHFNSGAFSYSTVPTLNGPGLIQFTGGTLTLLNNPIPNLQMTGGTITLGPSFQGGTITNLTLIGSTLGGTYTVSGTLNCGNGIAGGLTVANGGTLNWSGGNITGVLTVAPGALANWSGGTAVNLVNVQAGGALNLIGSNLKVIENVLTNAGTVTWLDGDFGVYNYNGGFTGAVENLAGGLWDIQCDRNMYDGYGGGTPRFDNAGAVQKSAGTGTTTFSIAFNNAGTMTAQTGTVSFNGGGIIESTFNASAGTAIQFNSGAFSYSTVPTLNGPGAIQFTGGTLTLLNNVIPNLQMVGGTISLSPSFQGGVITNLTLIGSTLGGNYTVTGTLNCGNGVAGGLTVTNGGALNWSGGNISGVLIITLNSVANWSGGTAVNLINVQPGGALNLIGSSTKIIENVLTNAGTVTWLDGDFGVYNYNGGFSGAVENLAGGLWDIQCDRNMYDGYGGGTPRFDNAGTAQKSAGTGTTTFSIPLNNSGTLDTEIGAITFNVNNGYTQTGATLRFGFGGPANSGQMRITGNMAFDGTLAANLVRGYSPQAGDTISLLTYNSHAGTFSHLNLPMLNAGLGWQLSYNAGAVQVQVSSNAAAPQHITGLVKDGVGNGVTNITVFAFTTNSSGSFYVSTVTDSSGHYSLNVSNAVWIVGLQGLPARGFNPAPDQIITINNADQVANFVLQPYAGQLYTITTAANPPGAGTTGGGGVFAPGSVVSVNAAAITSTLPYYFTNWTENGLLQSANSTYSFVAQRDRQLTANFTLPLYTISVSNNPPAAGVVLGARTNFYGDTNVLTAQPNFGYNFSNWTENAAVLGTSSTLSTVIYTNHFFVANYAEANLFHVASTATFPGGIATVSGAGTYTNGQTALFSAPATVTISPYIYTFQKFTLSNNLVSASPSFSKTFATTDWTNLQYVAVYSSMNVVPQVTNTVANYPMPVPATANLILSFRFDRTMNTNFTPTVVLTNSATTLQPAVTGNGSWSSGAVLNDTYFTPAITLVSGMDGTNQVFISGARDTNGDSLGLTNTLALIVDATTPVLSGITATPAAQSAEVDWTTDEAATSQVDYGLTAAYGASTSLFSQLVKPHAVILSGLNPATTYHFRVRSRDLAGNETASADQTFVTLAAPDLQVQNLAASGTFVSGGNIVVSWTDANTGPGATYTSWYDQVIISNATAGQTLLNNSLRYDASSSGNINSGGSVSRQTSFQLPDGPLGAGTLQITVIGNAYNNQFETSLNNNTASLQKTSTLPAYPDLQVVNLAVTNASLQSGGVLGIRWQDTNSGSAAVSGSFQDRVTIVNLDTAETLASSGLAYDVNASGTIAAGQAANRQFVFTLPNGNSGAGHLLITVVADAANNIFEYNAGGTAESNNTNSVAALSALAAYPDLAATNVIVPAGASAGQTIPIIWTDLNLGNAPATNQFSDQVFVSDTASVNGGQWLGTFAITNNFAAGDSLAITQSVTLPPFASGNQWIIVKANASGSFFELNTANNSIVSTQAVNVGATLTLALNRTTVSESAGVGAVTGTVSRNGDTSSALTVNLSSATGTNVSLPPSVTIPAGQHGANFSMDIIDNLIAGGSALEMISASAAGFPTATAPLTVLHDDVAMLTLTLNTNAVPENAASGVAFGTVTRNANLGQPLAVTLVSDLPSALTVPVTVTIPAGQASATFALTPVNDNVVGDTRTVHLLAGAAGFSAVSVSIDVLNVNSTQLSLQLANASVSKGAPSPATIGTVSRSPVVASAQSVYLQVTNNPLVTVPTIVTIPAGAASVDFNVNVGDDNLATGPTTAALIAQVLTPARIIETNGETSAVLTVLDTHGPSLTLSFADNTIAKGSNTTATLTRNTPPTNSLTVNLSALPSDAITLPASVTIPQNQTATTFTISGILDKTQTGPRKVAVTASATGFNSGVGNVTVSDIYFPDLLPTSVTVPANALTSGQITVSWVVANRGLADATGQWFDYVYLASDSLGESPAFVAFQTNSTPLPIGASYTNQATFYLPDAPANYWIVVTTDGGNVVTELNKQNNSFVSATPITVDADYRAVLTDATPPVAASGTPIVLTGHTFNPLDNSPAPSKIATVRILVNGTRRVYSVTSDASGNFTYTFQPLATEAGDYTAGADYPLISDDPSQVSFSLLGMQALPAGLTAQLLPSTPVTNQLILSNLTDHALTGLAVSVPNLQGNLNAQFTLTNTSLPGNGTMTVNYTLQSPLTRVAQIKFAAQVTSTEGAQLSIPANVTVVPLTAQLVANPGFLAQGMLVGDQTIVSFDIINTGGAASGDLTVQLPATLPWMSLSSPAVIPSIPPGGKATVILALNPPSDLALTLYQGSLALANNNIGLSMPFQFRAVSSGKGDLRVTATDDYTYYVTGAPKVTNATVTVRDAITTAVIAQTNSDANGIAYFAGLPAGPYTVDASATQHNQYRGSATVVTGNTNDLEAFMPRQLVSYQWSVVPTEVPDEYKIQLESVFETEVPVPNVVIEEPQVMMFVAPGEITQFELKMRNEGLIAAQGVTILPVDDPTYLITPLVSSVGTIPAQSEVSIPVTIQLRASPATNSAAWRAAGSIKPNGLGPECGYSPSPCLPKIDLNVQYYVPCGGNNVVEQRSAQLALLCTGLDLKDKILSCLKSMQKLTGSQNLASVGCNAVSAFIKCVGPSLDPCVMLAINTACGALTGGVAGAAAAGLPGLPACICAHLSDLPLPSFPSSSGGGGGGGGDILLPILPTGSYYVSGSPVITAITFGTCSGPTPALSSSTPTLSGPHTVRKLIGSPLPPLLQAPIKPAASSICAHVRLRIDQDVVLTRSAFAGTLEIDNGSSSSITGIQVALNFQDATNGVAADKFVTEGPVLTTLTAVDGTGSLAGGATGSAVYTFVPTVDAAPDAPATFQIGGTLSYIDSGQQVVVPLLSAPITVYPEARLDLDYFQQRDVYGDDPFTPEIEPSEPFALGLIVKNVGAGNAHSFRITSGQPQIVENEKGLLINFTITGTTVGDQPISPTLTANLGDITPGGSKEVTWDMLSTLQGKFISFSATFEHVNDLGSTNTSLINSVAIHELIHKVLANRSTDDDVPDFLVNDIPDPDNLPDTLYLSDGSTAPVTTITNATFDNPAAAGHLSVQLTAVVSNGWNYIQVPDPGAGFRLDHVLRSDGKPIALTNDAWTTDRSFPASSTAAVHENLLHIFDFAGSGAYTIYYRSTNSTPPAIVQLGPVTPFIQPGAVSSINVVFSEPIDLSVFDPASLVLTRNGGANLIGSGSGITLTLISGSTYAINGLGTLTAVDGNYQLTVNGSGIYDLWGNNGGNISASVQWTKGNAPAVVQSLDTISPNPRNAPVTSLNVTFSKAINAATFDYHALSLTLNGGPNLITSAATVTPVSSTSFTIGGLGSLTGSAGDYLLTVNAAGVQDSGGTAGFSSKSVSWTMLTTGPRITALEQLATNPRNIVVQSLNVTFAQPIDPATFDYNDVTLTHDNGTNLITSDVTVTPVNSTTWKIANFNWVVGLPGAYTLTVNAAGIADPAGNPGAGNTNETWQMVLETPPTPTNLTFVPDLGISATDGLTSTNSIMLSGTVAASNLTVRLADQTSGQDLGTAAVIGTNFSQTLTFTEGQHHLRFISVDAAGNVSGPSYLDLFVDLTAPTAVIQSVSPNPITTPVTNLLVTFSKAINTNTIQAANFTLTRNGTNAGAPAIVITSSNTVVVTNLAVLTAPIGFYQLTLNWTGIQDLAGNSSAGSVSTTWQAVLANQPPIITQEPNATAQPGVGFQRLVQASDPEGNNIQFSLAAGAPAGAGITTNGFFTWTPACDQGGTTNNVTIWATDDGVPSASNSMTFSIAVGDCVQIQIGSAVVQVGTTGSVPVIVFSSASVTNLNFTLGYPTNRFGSWSIAASNSAVGSATAQSLNSAQAAFSVVAAGGQSLQGSAVLGALSFSPLPAPSAFVPLTVVGATATKSGNSPVSSVLSDVGRVVVIGAEPLLEAHLDSNSARQLILYGNPGASYQIGASTNLGGTNWLPVWRVPMTNLSQTFGPSGALPRAYYRAWRFFADPPLLDLNLPARTNVSFMLYGRSGTNYTVESATNLMPGTTWSPATNVSLTNSFYFINTGTPTNKATFFRARR